MTTRHVRVACWVPKATKWLHESAFILRDTYIACLVFIKGLHMKGAVKPMLCSTREVSFELETARDCFLS